MSEENYFFAFKFVSGALAFTLLTFLFRFLGEKTGGIDSQGESSADDQDQWLGLEKLEIIDIYEETNDIKTFKLKRKDKLIPHYSPPIFKF